MIKQLRKTIKNPWLIPLAISHRYYRWTGNDNATSVMNEDWDNLIILDACRFDIFQSSWEGPGNLYSIISMGSNTPEWLTRTFTDTYPDTVYVTGNPQVQANDIQGRFHDCVSVWESNWDEQLNTVHPKNMADETLAAADHFDNKRLISHWIQPHYPFIGRTGSEIEQRTLTGDGTRQESTDTPTVWEKLEQGNLDKTTVWRAYKENLEIALPELYRTIKALDGRTIVTSDHGNVFGRYNLYGHPGAKFIEELVKVPWLIVGGDRREIHAEETSGYRVTDKKVKSRLEHLGYK